MDVEAPDQLLDQDTEDETDDVCPWPTEGDTWSWTCNAKPEQ